MKPAALLVLGTLLPVPQYANEQAAPVDDMLEELWEWNFGMKEELRYTRQISSYTPLGVFPVFTVETVGDVRVQQMDTPKENVGYSKQHLKDDVMTAFPRTWRPAGEDSDRFQPAVATLRFLLGTNYLGVNRLRLSVHLTSSVCVERTSGSGNTTTIWTECTPPYDADQYGQQPVTAWLAPAARAEEQRRKFKLRDPTATGEWQELLADFYGLGANASGG